MPTAPLPIMATPTLEDRVRELEDALIHAADFMPRHVSCDECRQMHALMYQLLVDRAKEQDWRKVR